MNTLLLCLLLTSIRSSVVSIKTEKEFQDMIRSGNALVKFFAPWCGHCKSLAPKYDDAAKTLINEHFDSTKVAEVDCTLDGTKALCSQYGIRGFPTIKYFSPSLKQPLNYDGLRESKDLILFIKRMARDSVIEIDSQEKLDRLVKENDLVVVEYAEGAPSEEFKKTADGQKLKYTFALIKDKKIMDSHNMKFEEVAMFRNFDDPKVVYSARGDINLPDWIEHHSFQVMGELDPGNYKKYIERKVPILWLAVDKNSKQSQELISELSKSLKQHKDHVLAIYIDGIKFKEALISMGFEDKLPCAMIFEKETKYKFDGEYKPEALEKFVADFKNKKLKMFMHSDEPEKNQGSLYEVVANTFQSVVMDKTLDVVLEYYQTGSLPCERFEPELKSLAKRFANNPLVKIARINEREQRAPTKDKPYPVLIMYRSNKKNEPIVYEGALDADNIEKWISQHSRTESDSDEKKEL